MMCSLNIMAWCSLNTFINDYEMQKRLLEMNPNSFWKLV
uniref:Uncharacterized protein n=2 Tax=Physcomitrium patens TaxID=3218 RepID=A0A7I3ZH75_PHYPA